MVLGSGSAPQDKPAKDLGMLACQKLSLNASDVIYVGDSITDFHFSKNMGFKYIMFGENLDQKLSSEKKEPYFIAKDHLQLAGFFQKKLLKCV